MIISLKNNRALLRSRRRAREMQEVRHGRSAPLVFDRKMSPAQFEAFKRRLRREKMAIDIRKIILLAVALTTAAIVVYLIIRAAFNL